MHSSLMRTALISSRPRGGEVSASVHAGIHPTRCGPGHPLGQTLNPPPCVWAWRPPWRPAARQRPGDPSDQTPQLPPGCGPGDPPGDLLQGMLVYRLQGMLGCHPPPVDLLQGMLGYHLQFMLGYHPSAPPCEQNS